MLSFDPDREPTEPRDAASVVLLRAREGGEAEVFLLRRHSKASFMPTATVFPGGGVDAGEDHRIAAARELFEEAAVLLTRDAVGEEQRLTWQARLNADDDEADLAAMLASTGVTLDVEGLVAFSHWITPSAEKRRFSARFFVTEVPAGQIPRYDDKETVSEVWLTPAEALAQAKELRLPPPQVRTLADIVDVAPAGPGAVLELARGRADSVRPIVPRFAEVADAPMGFALLLPWDPEYDTIGRGAGEAFPADHPHGGGPSRFVLDDLEWRNVDPPR